MKRISTDLRRLIRRGDASGLVQPTGYGRVLFGPILQEAREKDVGLSTAITLTVRTNILVPALKMVSHV
jgi:hypothetical protein